MHDAIMPNLPPNEPQSVCSCHPQRYPLLDHVSKRTPEELAMLDEYKDAAATEATLAEAARIEVKRLENENGQLLARIDGQADFIQRLLERESKSAQFASDENTLRQSVEIELKRAKEKIESLEQNLLHEGIRSGSQATDDNSKILSYEDALNTTANLIDRVFSDYNILDSKKYINPERSEIGYDGIKTLLAVSDAIREVLGHKEYSGGQGS